MATIRAQRKETGNCRHQSKAIPRQDQHNRRMRFCTASAVVAYAEMMDRVRSKYRHLSKAELLAKLHEARDEYSRNLRKQK